MTPHRMSSKDRATSPLGDSGSGLRFRAEQSLLLGFFVLPLACGFPEVGFESGSGGSSPTSSTSTTTSTSSGGGGASTSGSGGSTSVGGGGGGGQGGAGPDPCDLDGDGKPAATPECMGAQGGGGSGGVAYDCDDDGDGFEAVGAPCNGPDCYDANEDARPNQTQYFSVHRGDGSFDYNCDELERPRWGSNTCGCEGGGTACSCDQRAVFEGATGCGTSGTFKPCSNFVITACEPQGAGVPSVLECR